MDSDEDMLAEGAAIQEMLAGGAGQGDDEPKQKRSSAHTAGQMEIIAKAHNDEKLGYRRIVKRYPTMGFTESGVKDALARLKANGTLGRQKGSGRKMLKRTHANIEAVREIMSNEPSTSVGDVMK